MWGEFELYTHRHWNILAYLYQCAFIVQFPLENVQQIQQTRTTRSELFKKLVRDTSLNQSPLRVEANKFYATQLIFFNFFSISSSSSYIQFFLCFCVLILCRKPSNFLKLKTANKKKKAK
jgi:hypothetical protein